jgi:uncharacterized membrane protein YdcZ (DUF606 family)
MYGFGLGAPIFSPLFGFGLVVLIIWSLFWKGLALWHSARREQPWWFVLLLIVNTAGILEIIYIFFVAKIKLNNLFKR